MNFGKNVVFAGFSLQWHRMCHLIVPKTHGWAVAVKTRNLGLDKKKFFEGFQKKISNKLPAAKIKNPKNELW